MQDSHSSSVAPGASTSRSTDELEEARIRPSSSRMLANYLADVEQNLDEHRWEMALRDVVDLPKIAVALTDPELRSSREKCVAWCEQWLRPSSAANESAVDHERICQVIRENSKDEVPSATVPSLALRRLRLRRHARNAPRGFNSSHTGKAFDSDKDRQDQADTFAICTAVVEAVRRWYAHSACRDAVTQANLARLAVLR
jgi:DNA-binding protein Fis